MSQRKKIEVYSAGCYASRKTEEKVRRIAGYNHDIQVHDMRQAEVISRAAQHGIKKAPTVVIDGQIAASWKGLNGIDATMLRSAIG